MILVSGKYDEEMKQTRLDHGVRRAAVGEGSQGRPDAGWGARERRAEGRGRDHADIGGKVLQEREHRPPRGDTASSPTDAERGQWGRSTVHAGAATGLGTERQAVQVCVEREKDSEFCPKQEQAAGGIGTNFERNPSNAHGGAEPRRGTKKGFPTANLGRRRPTVLSAERRGEIKVGGNGTEPLSAEECTSHPLADHAIHRKDTSQA